MDTFALVDLYCERTNSEFWNEPFNALSNSAFIVTACWAIRYTRRHSTPRFTNIVLILLTASIGIGSFLFHTFATVWAELADVIPIWSFVALYIAVLTFRINGENLYRTAASILLALCIAWLIVQFSGGLLFLESDRESQPLNGSLQYAPALVALIIFSLITCMTRHPARYHLLLATVGFSVALVFRTVDHATCTLTNGVGTHFIWHIVNALVIGILLHALITRIPSEQ